MPQYPVFLSLTQGSELSLSYAAAYLALLQDLQAEIEAKAELAAQLSEQNAALKRKQVRRHQSTPARVSSPCQPRTFAPNAVYVCLCVCACRYCSKLS